MKRDYKIFPNDENGDVLWRMYCHGDKLENARTINFSVIFPKQESALEFGIYLLKNGQRVQFSEYEESEEFPWEITVSPVMQPTHQRITDYETLLEKDSAKWGGKNDGWGCFQQG